MEQLRHHCHCSLSVAQNISRHRYLRGPPRTEVFAPKVEGYLCSLNSDARFAQKEAQVPVNMRAMVILQGSSLLPEDRYVNVFHFVRLDDLESAAAAVHLSFEDLYGEIGDMIGGQVLSAAEVRYYDLGDPEPRVPIVMSMTIPTNAEQSFLPSEAAIVVSFRGEPPHTARRRGRVYIGPLNNSVVVETVGSRGSPPPRIGQDVINRLVTAFSLFNTQQPGWRIRSTVPSENFVPVTNGWVDNAFDTQRRRGEAPTSRTIWDTTG